MNAMIDAQPASPRRDKQKVLLLGGTSEANGLAQALAAMPDIDAVYSFAGRTQQPRTPPIPHRIGGFGGIDGLAAWLAAERIDAVIDATHPFAAQMSANAVAACARTNTRLIALERAPWQAREGDRWIAVDDLDAAAKALGETPRRVFLAIGRLHLPVFAKAPQHDYVVRLVDPPAEASPLPSLDVIVARGPFDAAGDEAMMVERGIEIVVAKNAGGEGSHAKIIAARHLGLPVIMIGRPHIPERRRVESIGEIMEWLAAE
jgi:precorrin-6A/cobalt-precorrin-6A reductase